MHLIVKLYKEENFKWVYNRKFYMYIRKCIRESMDQSIT